MKRRGKGLTWAEAAKVILERFPKTPMSHKEVFKFIRKEKLKDATGGNAMLCLNSCMHANSRGIDGMFYKVAGCSGFYGLMNDIPAGSVLCELDEGAENLTEILDDEGQPIGSGQASQRPFNDKRKDKVMYVKLPEGMTLTPFLSCQVNGSPSTSDATVTGDEGVSEGVSETFSLDNGSAGNSLDDVSTEASVVSDGSLATVPTVVVKPKRRPRNDPLRHYRRTRKKRNQFAHLRPKIAKKNDGNKPALMNYKRLSDKHRKTNTSGTNPLTGVRRVKRQSFNDILANIPGLKIKAKVRGQKLVSSAQVRRLKQGCVDLETPNSFLVDINLRTLINTETFSRLPEAYQYQLAQLLPACDRILLQHNQLSVDSSALTNEFFSKACQEWRERLAEGEFTQENQQKIKNEEERLHQKIDPWKVKHFEPVWGSSRSLRSPPISLPSPPPVSMARHLSKVQDCASAVTNSSKLSAVRKLALPKSSLARKAVASVLSSSSPSLTHPTVKTENFPAKLKVDLPVNVKTEDRLLGNLPVKNEHMVKVELQTSSSTVPSLLRSPPRQIKTEVKDEPAQSPLEKLVKRAPVMTPGCADVLAKKARSMASVLASVPSRIRVETSAGVAVPRILQPPQTFSVVSKTSVVQAPRLGSTLIQLPPSSVTVTTTRTGSSIIQPSKFGSNPLSYNSMLRVGAPVNFSSTELNQVQSSASANLAKVAGRTRTLADIKAQNKAKRDVQSKHTPSILQTCKRMEPGVLNARPIQGIDIERSQHIVNQVIQETQRNHAALQESQRNHAAAANVPAAIPSTLIIRTVTSTTANSARESTVINRSTTANPLQQQQQPLFRRVSSSVPSFTSRPSIAQVRTGPQLVVTHRVQPPQNSFSSQTNPHLAAALQQAPGPPIPVAQQGTSTTIRLPPNLPSNSVLRLDQKNLEAAGGHESLSFLSSTTSHQPLNQTSSDDSETSSSFTESHLVRAGYAVSKDVSLTHSASPASNSSSSSGILPKIKFVRVTLPSGESQYVVASKDDRLHKTSEGSASKVATMKSEGITLKAVLETEDISIDKEAVAAAGNDSHTNTSLQAKPVIISPVSTKNPNTAITTTSYTNSALLQALCGSTKPSTTDLSGQGGRNYETHSKGCALKLCNLKAMEACKKCGAFSHHECSGPSKLCVQCLLVTTVN